MTGEASDRARLSIHNNRMPFRLTDSLLPCTDLQRATELSSNYRRDVPCEDAYSERTAVKEAMVLACVYQGLAADECDGFDVDWHWYAIRFADPGNTPSLLLLGIAGSP